ncbi:L,D-transpeptidase Cds6 family protein [Desulfonatronum lacustre]|uniref:L,D-transpeptidase Cds6 family protein n=1 Tax=Desulfonatronum lacustre TaxID=66849 RepID=UPI00048B0ACC|nr:tetratricopeptide repeat protein [Desulfonatronum lacustre]
MKYISCLAALCVLFWSATPLFSAPSGLETAQEFFAEERVADAYQAIQGHLQRHPKDTQGLFLKGVILERLGRFSEAMEVYHDLIERHPELPEPYNNLAGLLAAAGRFEEAKDTLQRALETHPSYATAHQNLSRIYSAMASSAYRRVLGKDDERILVRLDPLEELSGTPDMPLPAATLYVASVAPHGPASVVESPPLLPSPAAPGPSPEPIAAAPKAASEAAPEATPEITPTTSPQSSPASAAEFVVPEAPEPSTEPVLEPVPEPVSEPVVEPAPEPVAPRPATPEQVIVPAPEPVPAPTAPAPPSVTPPAPPASEAPAPRPSPDTVKAAITDVVLNWANAWASQNVEAYLSFYSGNFQPERGLSLAQWREQRRTRVAAPPFINVTLSNIVVTILDENAAQVRFAQRYRSNVINDEVSKELQLRKEGGQWRITRERLLPRS